MANLTVNEFTEMLQNTKPCKGLARIQESVSCQGIQVCKEKFEFPKHDVLIVRSQWTKTQGGYSIRVNNYYAAKRHFLQIPMDNLKQCKTVIDILKTEGEYQLWTGHHVKVN